MKKPILAAMLMLAITTLQCTRFPSRYDRIEAGTMRPIGFVYDPEAEGAPGDTIHLHAYFSGEPVVSIAWQLSYDHIINAYGTDTIINYRTMQPINLHSNLPDSVDFSFVVPESTFFQTQAISRQTLAALKSNLPAAMATMTQQQFASFLQALGEIAGSMNDPAVVAAFLQQWGASLGIDITSPAAPDSLNSIAGKVLAVFSVHGDIRAVLSAASGAPLGELGEFTIRYNRRFQNTSLAAAIPVNHNPPVEWAGVYKVAGSGSHSFTPWDRGYAGTFTLTYLFDSLGRSPVTDTIDIDTGYCYFFAVDSGMNAFTRNDSTIIDTLRQKYLIVNASGRTAIALETWFYDWEYQNLDLNSVRKAEDSLLVLSPGSANGGGRENSFMEFLPSLDTRMTHTRIWITVYNSYLGELNRPVGFTIRCIDVYFRYSDAYRAKHG